MSLKEEVTNVRNWLAIAAAAVAIYTGISGWSQESRAEAIQEALRRDAVAKSIASLESGQTALANNLAQVADSLAKVSEFQASMDRDITQVKASLDRIDSRWAFRYTSRDARRNRDNLQNAADNFIDLLEDVLGRDDLPRFVIPEIEVQEEYR